MAAATRATLDFFAAQEAARRRTAVLVGWFALAWLGTIALVFAALSVVLEVLDDAAAFRAGIMPGAGESAHAFTPALLAVVVALVTFVTACGTGWHAVRLARGGGHAVARMVGGVPVDRATTDPAERRLVNVVEEMAIASGLPVPALYVLPGEEGINAFAAGFTPDRAVVAVTKGALDALTRDELQGVVAHELSHLLNSDTRLNLRLVALIGGITVLALVGRVLMRGSGRGRRSRGGGRERLLLAVVGASFWIAGSVGAFFGRVIRAAVSRQREFLADAAAVQFTRNPDGLAGALAKIAVQGSAIGSAQGPEVSHLFFASGLRSSWLATHPPIEERVRRIAPHRAVPGDRVTPVQPPVAKGAPETPPGTSALAASPAAAAVASIGRPAPRQVAHASELLARVPPAIAAASRTPASACSLVRALLADPDAAVRELQLRHVADPPTRAAVEWLAGAMAGASREDRMAVLELALPALDALPSGDAETLARELAAMAGADGRTTVFEWALQRIVRRRVAWSAGERRGRHRRASTVDEVQVEAHEVLSVLSWLGAGDDAGAQAALDAGTVALGVRGSWRPLGRDRVRAARLDAALSRLDDASPAVKARLVAACAACVLGDGRVTAAESEVFRAIAASLGVPVPPAIAVTAGSVAGAA